MRVGITKNLLIGLLVFVLALGGLLGAAPSLGQAPAQMTLPDDIEAFDAPDSSIAQARRLLGMGFHAIRKKDYVNAEILLLKARRIDPGNPYVLLNLGVVFHRTNRPKLAREMWTRVANAPVAAASNSVITSSSALVGESPAVVARKNLALLE
ncbi:hypothetical protein BH09PSE5_BH09PSE5_25120 [soil metagenome]